MTFYDHHLCFVSSQNVAELLGALVPASSCAHVHALVSQEMSKKAKDLQTSCQRRNLDCTIYKLADREAETIKKTLSQIRNTYSEDSFAVNISGGTKLMAIAAFEWAQSNKLDAIYIDTAAQEIDKYSSGNWHKLALPQILNVEDLLNLYGYNIESKNLNPAPAKNVELLQALIELSANEISFKAFHALNKIAITASQNPSLSSPYSSFPLLADFLKLFKKSGKLTYSAKTVTFLDEEARKWCNGLWLEEYVRSLLSSLKVEKRITSWSASVHASGNFVFNELDALFTANNRLHFIECKTSKGASSPVYKSFSLRENLGGSFAKSLICSVDKLSEADAHRASEYNIQTVTGAQLKDLRKHILDWIKRK